MKNRVRDLLHGKKNEAIVLAVDFLIICASYALLAGKHVSLDGYYFVNGNDLWAPLSAGRLVWAAILQLLTALNVNVFHEQGVFLIILMATMAWCTMRVLSNTKKDFLLQEGILYSIPLLLGFVNVYIQEWFIFAETALFYSIGIVTAVEAAIAVSRRKYVWGSILLLTSVLCYQITLSMFIVYALFFVYNKGERSIKDYIPAVVIGDMSGVASIVVQKIVKATVEGAVLREVNFSLESILQKLQGTVQKLWETFLDAQGILPPAIIPVLVVASLVTLAFFSVKNKSLTKDFVLLGLLIVVCLGVIILPILLSSESVWMPPRVIVGTFTLISMLALSAALRSEGVWRTVVTVLTLAVLVVNIFVSQAISVDVFKNNVLDQHLDHQAHAYIEQYEKESGNTVKNIAFYNDSAYDWSYPEIEHVWYDTNVRTILVSFARLNRINYHCSENYVSAEPSEEIYEQYFAGKNWDVFMPDEQLVFVGDTLHWCIY